MADSVTHGVTKISADHLPNHFRKGNLRTPAQFALCLGSVPQKRFHLGAAKVTRIHQYNCFAEFQSRQFEVMCVLLKQLRRFHPCNNPLFLNPLANPFQLDTYLLKGTLAAFADRMLFAGSNHIIVRRFLLQDKPLRPDEVTRVAPVSKRPQVAEVKPFLQS